VERLLNIKQAAYLLNICVPKLYRLVEARKIVHVRLGGKIVFQPSKLEEWVEKHSIKENKN